MTDNSPYEAPESDVSIESTAEKLTLKEILFSFKGRIPRKVYWIYGFLGIVLLMLITAGVIVILQSIIGETAIFVALPVYILVIWISLAVQVKRWHDRDKSGWWVLIGIIPIIGPIWQLVECGFLVGTPVSNRFGPVTASY